MARSRYSNVLVCMILLTVAGFLCRSAFGERPTPAKKLYVSKTTNPEPFDKGPPDFRKIRQASRKIAKRDKSPWIKGPTGVKHPIVLFDPEDIPRIRERLQRGAGPRIMTHLERSAKSGQVAAAGLYAVLTGRKQPPAKAIKKLIKLAGTTPADRLLRHGGQLYTLALGYDLLYNYMTPKQRATVRKGLARSANKMYAHDLTHQEGNWLPHCWGAMGIAGFALQQENRHAEDWIRRARQANRIYMHNTFDPEGANYEATSRYFAMGIDKVMICFAADRRQGFDYFGYRDNVMNQTVEFAAYMLLPNRRAWVPFDDAFVSDVDCTHYFAAMAGLTGDPLAQALYDDVFPAPRTWTGNVLLAAAWYDPNVPKERPSDSPRLPLARAYWTHRSKGMGLWSSGHVFMRTGFDNPKDILFAAQCGDTGGWHGHADQSSFYLYAYGDVLVLDPAIEGGYGQPLCEWMKGPEAHNLVLIDGQTSPDYTVGDKKNWPKKYHHGGEIDGFVHTKTLDFVSMDFREGLALNPKIGEAKRAKRYVVFFRHPNRTGYFVIVDDVTIDDKPHCYEWLLQPDPKHKAVKEGPGRFAFTGRVDLKIRMIHPAEPVHKTATFEGYGVDYLRIRSRKDRKRGLFLTILYPKTKSMTMPKITPIRRNNVLGAKIGEDVILFNRKLSGPMVAKDIRADGELAALRISDGKVLNAILLEGKTLEYKGQPVSFERGREHKKPKRLAERTHHATK